MSLCRAAEKALRTLVVHLDGEASAAAGGGGSGNGGSGSSDSKDSEPSERSKGMSGITFQLDCCIKSSLEILVCFRRCLNWPVAGARNKHTQYK